jgi:hypothetical protein
LEGRSEEDTAPSAEERVGNFDPEKFFRIFQRLHCYFSTPPAALAPVLKFPEVFVLIAVSILIYIIWYGIQLLIYVLCVPVTMIQLYGFLCFGASAANLPFLFFFGVALNGTTRFYSSDIIQWLYIRIYVVLL